MQVEVRTALLPPFSVSDQLAALAGKPSDGQATGSSSDSWLVRLLRPAVYVNGFKLASPWGEPQDYRLGWLFLLGLLLLGGWALFQLVTHYLVVQWRVPSIGGLA